MLSYIEQLVERYPSLTPLIADSLVSTKNKNIALYKALQSHPYLMLYHVLFSKYRSYKNILIKQLKESSMQDRIKIYKIFAQYPDSYIRLLDVLTFIKQDEANLYYDDLKLLTQHYDRLYPKKPHRKRSLSWIGKSHVKKLLKSSTYNQSIKKENTRWSKLYDNTSKGNLKNGALLFTSLCLSCHTSQNLGIGIAPNLDGLDNCTKEGLITAITNPNASSEEIYRKTYVKLKSGEEYVGLLKNKENDYEIYFMGGSKVAFKKYQISYAQESSQSFMPNNIFNSLSDKQIIDLLSYIKTLK